MDRPSREDMKRIMKVERGADNLKYRIVIKNINMELSKQEYIALLSARGMSRSYLAHELKKSIETVTDTDFYKFVVNLGCDTLLRMAHDGALKQQMSRVVGEMLKASMSDEEKAAIREIERELDAEENHDGTDK